MWKKMIKVFILFAFLFQEERIWGKSDQPEAIDNEDSRVYMLEWGMKKGAVYPVSTDLLVYLEGFRGKIPSQRLFEMVYQAAKQEFIRVCAETEKGSITRCPSFPFHPDATIVAQLWKPRAFCFMKDRVIYQRVLSFFPAINDEGRRTEAVSCILPDPEEILDEATKIPMINSNEPYLYDPPYLHVFLWESSFVKTEQQEVFLLRRNFDVNSHSEKPKFSSPPILTCGEIIAVYIETDKLTDRKATLFYYNEKYSYIVKCEDVPFYIREFSLQDFSKMKIQGSEVYILPILTKEGKQAVEELKKDRDRREINIDPEVIYVSPKPL